MKYYYLYEVKNKLDGKVYRGVHQTSNLEDGYMGSGKFIKRAIKKHGLENFEKTILEWFDNPEDMYKKESEVVTEEFCKRDDTYNLIPGGKGGFYLVNTEGLNNYKKDSVFYAQTSKKLRSLYQENPEKREACSRRYKNEYASGVRNAVFSGDSEHMQSLSLKAKEANSGSVWINNGFVSKKLKKHLPLPDGWRKGRISRGMELLGVAA